MKKKTENAKIGFGGNLSDKTITVTDFTRSSPFVGYKPSDIKVSEGYLSTEYIESLTDKIIHKGNLDEANGDVIDSMLFEDFVCEFTKICNAYISNIESIHSLNARHQTDLKAIKAEIANTEKLLNEEFEICNDLLIRIKKEKFVQEEV